MRRNAAQGGSPIMCDRGALLYNVISRRCWCQCLGNDVCLVHVAEAVMVEELLDGVARVAASDALELLLGELVALRLGEGDHLLGRRAGLAPCIPAGTMDVPH